MWEYTIILPTSKYNIALKLKQQLSVQIKQVGGVCTIISKSSHTTLLIACKEQYKQIIKTQILEHISNIIVINYKQDYLLQHFNFTVSNDINMQALIKALIVFDSDIDKQIVIEKLKSFDSVDLDSFFNFRLKILKIKWFDLVKIANDNIMYLFDNNNFLELLKFIISNIDYRTSKVTIKFKQNNFRLYDASNRPIQDNMVGDISNCDDICLITSIIALAPQKICLYCDTSIKNSTVNLLFQLFNDRIEIIK